MIILSTPHCLRDRGINQKNETYLLHSANLDGTTTTIINNSFKPPFNIVMGAAGDNLNPLFIDGEDDDDDESMMDASSHASSSSPTRKEMLSDSVTFPTFYLTRPSSDESFSWSDFPLLTQDVVYVDPAFQPRKATTVLKKQDQSSNGQHTKFQERNDENDLLSSNVTRPFKVSSSTKPALHKALTAQARTTNTTALREQTKNTTSIRKIRFDAVHIREHSVTVGDHDWCEGILAVTLDWPHVSTPKSMLISDYEYMRERQGRVPRGHLPKLEHWQRKQLLERVGGMTEEELRTHENMEKNRHPSYPGMPRTKTVACLTVA
jgi:hypothetical protein